MSLVLAARRRSYVLVLFRERLGDARTTLEPLRRLEAALSTGMTAGTPIAVAESTGPRLVTSARVHRRWGRSLVGFSFFVLTTD